ncbi:MAG: tetratricopeptide repeat protein [Bacteroidales bacterium]
MRAFRFRLAASLSVVLLVAAAARGLGQAADKAQPSDDLVAAKRALNEGRYADVEAALRSAVPADSERAALRAKAAIAIGEYDRAAGILRPAVNDRPTGEAALELGLLCKRLGRPEEAKALLGPLVEPASRAPEVLLRAGRAARALGDYKAANDLLREAAAASPGSAEIQVAWGDLLLEKHNHEEATHCFEAAVRADSRSVDALLGLARAASDQDIAGALSSVRRALEVNGSSVAAHVLMADLLLDAGYDTAAREALQRALAVNGHSLEANAHLAAIARVENRTRDFEAALSRALATNPRYGEGYRIVAAQLAAHYRFDEAAELARQAVALDPGNSTARAELGMDLLRTGEEDEARKVLESAFEADPYNVVTYNLLAVLDALQQFETVRAGDVVLRLDPHEAAVLKEPAVALATEALRTLSSRYGFTPRGPILVEIFPHHDDFAVRNLGIPGLVGALGACFGRVVTMDSPRARPPGTFDWQATLWHELTHVITLQMSAQRVPRWLTEGISVFEEQRARPDWRRSMEEAFARALNHEIVPPLEEIDGAFADAKRISLAYFQAGQAARYLNETYGQAKFNELLRAFADGSDTDAVFTRVLGVNLAGVQRGFAQAIDKWFGPLRRALREPARPVDGMALDQLKSFAAQYPDNYTVQLALGAALRSGGDDAGAARAYNRAAILFPMASGTDSPHAVLAEMALARGDQAGALAEMQKQLDAEPVNVELARRIVGTGPGDGVSDGLRRAYARIVAVDPFDGDAHAALGRLARQQGDSATAVRELRAALAAGVADGAGTRCDLAEAYLAAADRERAKREVMAVLEQKPMYQRAQELLLRVVEVGR